MKAAKSSASAANVIPSTERIGAEARPVPDSEMIAEPTFRADPSSTDPRANPGILNHEDLKILRSDFTKDRLGVKVQSLNKDRTRAMLVQYLQHTDVQDRLEEVDPAWSIQVLQETQQSDTVYVRCRMTLRGVSRENVGEGGDPKSAYSDALKRCAMLFGVGRYLYDAPTVWTPYDESRDKFRQWTPDDYLAALAASGRRPMRAASSDLSSPGAKTESGRQNSATSAAAAAVIEDTPKPSIKRAASPGPASPAPTGASVSPVTSSAGGVTPGLTTSRPGKARPREELNRILLNLYRPYLTQFPETQFAQLLKTRYEVSETRLMSVEQLEDLIQYMEGRLRSVA